MSTGTERTRPTAEPSSHKEAAPAENTPRSAPQPVDGWTPEDREPSAAENNFMSIALFGFLILFGVGCLIVF